MVRVTFISKFAAISRWMRVLLATLALMHLACSADSGGRDNLRTLNRDGKLIEVQFLVGAGPLAPTPLPRGSMEFLDAAETAATLGKALPTPETFASSENVFEVLQSTLGKRLIFVRAAYSEPWSAPDERILLPYSDWCKTVGLRDRVTARMVLKKLLDVVNGGRLNTPANDDEQYNNFVLLTKRHILVIALSVAPPFLRSPEQPTSNPLVGWED